MPIAENCRNGQACRKCLDSIYAFRVVSGCKISSPLTDFGFRSGYSPQLIQQSGAGGIIAPNRRTITEPAALG
ncbi:hypothetical protein C0Z17_06805 [Trinickia caryophylli]|nr:hypothetical protein C0Z17_06805 [Trinickia caryophylli]